jgi:large subunit ribosomal protein L17
MKHHKAIRKLGRPKRQRTALMRSLARSLVIHDKITTTEAKAKEIRPYVEKMITRGKTATVATQRFLVGELGKGAAAKKVLETLSVKYKDRKGGYTRITKLPVRATDAAKMAQIEFV